MSRAFMDALRSVTELLVVVCSQHVLPTITCVTYLCGILKQKVYSSNLHTIEELKEDIWWEVFPVALEKNFNM
jgi:hypothetical protein